MAGMNIRAGVLIGLCGLAGVGAAGLVGCAADGSGEKATTSTASASKTASTAKTPSAAEAMFGKVKGLAGTWVSAADEKGQTQTTTYRVVSGGSAVCETMAVGSEYEMINMYHLDGDRLMVTHYCAMGNQPRMACSTQASPTTITFEPESVTNLASPGQDHMAKLELVMPDNDHLTQKWISMKDGKMSEHVEFSLTRRQW